VKTAGGDAHPARHGAIESVPEPQPRGAEVVLARPALHALTANAGGCLADHAITLAEAADTNTGLCDGPAELVPQHDRHVDVP
jgi:hypothetical protein